MSRLNTATKWNERASKDRKNRKWLNIRNKVILFLTDIFDYTHLDIKNR